MTPRERARDVVLSFISSEKLSPPLINKVEELLKTVIEEERQSAKDTSVSYDAILESNLSEKTKHEIFEWLWARRILDDDQYRLAMSRIEYIEKSKGD